MHLSKLLSSASLLVALAPAFAQHAGHGAEQNGQPSAPYAGEQAREIKALSPQEQRAWAEGQGMGLAKAAELNGYPGPMHVLELADRLQLTPEQAAATKSLMDLHKAEVRRLGLQLLEAERELDQLFREKRVTDVVIQSRTDAIAKLQAQIRASHLSTHLKQAALLEPAQVERYSDLRGYK